MAPQKSKFQEDCNSNASFALIDKAGKLPPELLTAIMNDVAATHHGDVKKKFDDTSRALSVCSRINRRWHACSIALLYRRVAFINMPERVAKFRRTLVDSPVLAALVADLDIQVEGDQNLPSHPLKMKKSLGKRQRAGKDFWDVLQVLTNLKTLKLARHQRLPSAYDKKALNELGFRNLASVQRFEVRHSSPYLVSYLVKTMTKLQSFSVAAVMNGRVLDALPPLTCLSFSDDHSYDWDDWLMLVKLSQNTLTTLELDEVNSMPNSTLASALAIAGPKLHCLFYSSTVASLCATVVAALPNCTALQSFRGSLSPTSNEYDVLGALSATIRELGLSHQSHFYTVVDKPEVVAEKILSKSSKFHALRVIWLVHQTLPHDFDAYFKPLKRDAKAKGLDLELRGCRYHLPHFSNTRKLGFATDFRDPSTDEIKAVPAFIAGTGF